MNRNQENMKAPVEDIALSEILRPLWVRRWKLVFFTLLITLLIAFYVSLLKPSFIATATLQIGNNKPSNTLSINNAFNETNASKEQVKTQYELLRSRKFAERVITRLNLSTHEEFNSNKYNDKISLLSSMGKNENPPSLNTVVSAFKERLTISPIGDTELVKITFRSYSPELSKQVANQIGETYLHYQDEIYNSSKETTSQWLVDQLEELGQKLEASELALQDYRESEGIVDIQGIVGLVASELTELTSSSLKAEKYRDDLKVTYEYIQNNKENIRGLMELTEVSSHATYVQLRRSQEIVERKVFELAKRYGPKHPKKIAVEAELESIEARIQQQTNDIITSIEKQYLSAVQKAQANKQRLATAKIDFLRLSRLKNKFFQLQREVDTNKELYGNYLVRLKEADAMGNYKTNFYVRFIDKATLPKSPIAPNKSLYIAISFILSFLAISIVVIMRELLVDTLNSRRKLDNFQEAPILAVLPKFKLDLNSKSHSEVNNNHFTEAVRTLRTALLFNGEKKPPKVIAVTSSVPSEGKSTVALHLARSFSEMEKVLLIEADLRHPTVAKNLNLDVHRPGLSNLLAKTHQINECIIRDKNVKLDILTSGISPANPLAFLSMKRFGMLIKVFGNFYDRIIIETPPVNAVSDAVIISKIVDSVIYVVHSSKTKREQITQGLRMLKQVNAPIEGVVINQSENIDTDKYQNKYYNDMANIIKLPMRKQM
ncbi:polysaccharide biosynthesis tyrosine autokinase [Colwellia sp. UCD-KL20]|uniref:GumC family protein n=1 Tax=Colwellia sp. UCD-KL20 TaxID=1917165 RepID=UPI0025712C34|nr:polysaccharide biosynthesis tyrosine autokinase [Colwellia sp. UCD-KL20]